MTLNHEYHSPDQTPALYVAPFNDNGTALQLTGVGLTSANALHVAIVDNTGAQIFEMQYTDGGTPPVHPIGNTIEWSDGANWQTVSTAKPLPIQVGDGTNTANVLKSDGTAAGQNAQLVGSAYLSQAWSVTSVSNLTGIDAGGYSWISIHITAQYTGSTPTITWQGSNDNTNWVGFSLIQPLSTLSSGSLSTTTSGVIFAGPLNFRYVRLAFTGTYSSSTSTGTILLSTTPRQSININGQVAINGTQAVQGQATGSAVPANAFYQGLNVRTSSPTAATNGNLVGATASVMGEQLIATGGLVTSSVPANASNVVVKAAPGRLCNVLVTTTGANPMLIYDNATTNSGTIIGCLPANPTVGTTYVFSMPAAAGITIAGSATNPAVTVSWI